jgi:hypothetical protein
MLSHQCWTTATSTRNRLAQLTSAPCVATPTPSSTPASVVVVVVIILVLVLVSALVIATSLIASPPLVSSDWIAPAPIALVATAPVTTASAAVIAEPSTVFISPSTTSIAAAITVATSPLLVIRIIKVIAAVVLVVVPVSAVSTTSSVPTASVPPSTGAITCIHPVCALLGPQQRRGWEKNKLLMINGEPMWLMALALVARALSSCFQFGSDQEIDQQHDAHSPDPGECYLVAVWGLAGWHMFEGVLSKCSQAPQQAGRELFQPGQHLPLILL